MGTQPIHCPICAAERGIAIPQDCPHLPSWVTRHSVNCYRCGQLVDERNCVPNTTEYGGNDDGGELCPNCTR